MRLGVHFLCRQCLKLERSCRGLRSYGAPLFPFATGWPNSTTSPKAAREGSATCCFSVGGFASGAGAGASGSGVGVAPRSSGAARAVAGPELSALDRTYEQPIAARGFTCASGSPPTLGAPGLSESGCRKAYDRGKDTKYRFSFPTSNGGSISLGRTFTASNRISRGKTLKRR
jgi:hypothetical protein